MKKVLLIGLLFLNSLLFAQETWQPIGVNDFDLMTADGFDGRFMTLDTNGVPFIIGTDKQFNIKIKKYVNTIWENELTTGLNNLCNGNCSIVIGTNNIKFIAYTNENNSLSVYKFDGTTWEIIGLNNFVTLFPGASGIPSEVDLVLDNNNIPWVTYRDNLSLKVVVQKFNGTSWEIVGNAPLSLESARYSSLAFNSNNIPYVSYRSTVNGIASKAIVTKYNGTLWEAVGDPSGVSDGISGRVSIAIDNNDIPYVTYVDFSNASKITVKKFNGTNWEFVGDAGFSTGQVDYPKIAISNDNIPYVFYNDFTPSGSLADKVNVKKFTGSLWENIGDSNMPYAYSGILTRSQILFNSTNIPFILAFNRRSKIHKLNDSSWEEVGKKVQPTFISAHSMGSVFNTSNQPFVFYYDSQNENKASMIKYNGFEWELLGMEGFSVGGTSIGDTSIDNNNIIYTAYKDEANNNKVTVQKFSGINWEVVGTSGFSSVISELVDIEVNNNNVPYVVYRDSENLNKATVEKFNGSTWEVVGIPGFSMENVMYLKLAIDSNNVLYVLCKNVVSENGYKPTLYKFNGTIWEVVGVPEFSPYEIWALDFAIDNNNIPFVIWGDADALELTVVKFNGLTWDMVGSSGISSVKIYDKGFKITIDENNVPYVLYSDPMYSDKLTLRKFNGISWEVFGTPGLSANETGGMNVKISNNIPIVVYGDLDFFVKYFGTEGALNTTQTVLIQAKNNIYPNPIKNEFSISGIENIQEIEIYDMLGKKVFHTKKIQNKINIELLPNGFYVLKAKTDKGVSTYKIIKE